MRFVRKMAILKPLCVFVLGPAGSFSSSAADVMLPGVPRMYADSLRRVFLTVHGDVVGIIPIANKIIGSITEVNCALKAGAFEVLRRKKMPVSFVCAAKVEITARRVRRVYCSMIAYRQCMRYLRRNFAHAKIIKNLPSTSSSYKKIVQLKRPTAVALGSEDGAIKYGLTILDRSVQDDPRDWTEFALIRRRGSKV